MWKFISFTEKVKKQNQKAFKYEHVKRTCMKQLSLVPLFSLCLDVSLLCSCVYRSSIVCDTPLSKSRRGRGAGGL